MTKTSEVLNRAADLIEERGWGQGSASIRPESDSLCLLGALGAAAGYGIVDGHYDYDDADSCPAAIAVHNYIGWREDPGDLWEWNDTLSKESGASRVIEVLRATALIEAAKEERAAMIEAERVATS